MSSRLASSPALLLKVVLMHEKCMRDDGTKELSNIDRHRSDRQEQLLGPATRD